MLSSTAGENWEKGLVKWLESTSAHWRPEETLCIIWQRGRWRRVLITLMDRNINTVKKLSSVQQTKAIKPSREAPKVEELRLDINHTQQWEQLTTRSSTLRNMELSVSLEIFTWFSFSSYVCSGFRRNQFWEISWPVLSEGSEVKITVVSCDFVIDYSKGLWHDVCSQLSCPCLTQQEGSQKQADLEVNQEFYLFLTSLDEDFRKKTMNPGLNFLKTLLITKALQIQINSLSFLLIPPPLWRWEAHPRRQDRLL